MVVKKLSESKGCQERSGGETILVASFFLEKKRKTSLEGLMDTSQDHFSGRRWKMKMKFRQTTIGSELPFLMGKFYLQRDM